MLFVVFCRYMFWTDWSSTMPRIVRAWMDGTHIRNIVSGSHNVYWPNGLSVDEHQRKIYWTDAHLDHIMSSDFNGRYKKILVQGHYNAPHPYSIAVYKVSLTKALFRKFLTFSQINNNNLFLKAHHIMS